MPYSLQITRQEWRWAIGWSITFLVASCIPYLIALAVTPAGWQFGGILVNPLDGQSYLAKIQQGIAGNWLFHLTYTPEPHSGVFVYIFYLMLGHLAALLRLSPVLVFHVARLVSGGLLLLVAFRFIAWVTPQRQERRLAFGLLLTASGLGWLGAMFGALPIDLWVPEAFVPYSIYTNPHFPLGMALMLFIFENIERSTFNLQRSAFMAALAALVLALTVPFALVVVWAVLAVFIIWRMMIEHRWPWPQIWLTGAVILTPLPVLIYDYWILRTNAAIAGWSAQNITLAPAPIDLFLGYGLVVVLAVVGGWIIVTRSQDPGEWLVLIWAVVGILLVYLPFFDLQRRLITGLHIPLCILAAMGLTRWLARSSLKLSQRRQVVMGIIAVGLLGTLLVWLIPLLALATQSPSTSETMALLFIQDDEAAALTWLSQHATADEVVLASPRLSLFIPTRTQARVFYGHPFETIEAKKKKAMVEAFYHGESETLSPPVDLIVYGPAEQKLGKPSILDSLPIVFLSNNLSIYEVKN
ncbi:MAG: hypothetical protein U0401_23745 [Anaerolineae bacterium]